METRQRGMVNCHVVRYHNTMQAGIVSGHPQPARVAQLEERRTSKAQVAGSIPASGPIHFQEKP